jgi:hypothetical protein
MGSANFGLGAGLWMKAALIAAIPVIIAAIIGTIMVGFLNHPFPRPVFLSGCFEDMDFLDTAIVLDPSLLPRVACKRAPAIANC